MSDFKVEARITRVEPSTPAISGRIAGVRFEPPPKVRFEDAALEDVDLSRLKIDDFMAAASTFDRCDFRRSALVGHVGGPPGRAVFRDCLFDRADLRKLVPGDARFERCGFDHARLDGWRCWQTEFVDCHFAGPLRDVEFRGISPYRAAVQTTDGERTAGEIEKRGRNEFRGNDFRDADLESVEFVGGVDLDAQFLPEDPTYIRLDLRPETIDLVEAAVAPLPPDGQAKARLMIKWIRGRYAGQDVAFTRRTDRGMFGLYQALLNGIASV